MGDKRKHTCALSLDSVCDELIIILPPFLLFHPRKEKLATFGLHGKECNYRAVIDICGVRVEIVCEAEQMKQIGICLFTKSILA